jgi:hypothetical protein
MYVTCIGGHVVSLLFDLLTSPTFSAFPASISQLAELRHIVGAGKNSAELTFPCEFGSLANLVALVWGGAISSNSGPLVFPADDRCMDGLVRLEEVMLGDYSVNRLPASIFSLPNIEKVSVRGAPLAALPPTMPPKLRALKLSATGISGPLPSFRNSPLLEEVALDNNRLTLGNASAFDFCPELKSVILSDNNISSDLFTFEGTMKLETFEASRNMIRGSIPSQWEYLKSCEKIVLSHNLLEASLKPMQKMTKLKYVDLVSRVRRECMYSIEHPLTMHFLIPQSYNEIEWGEIIGTDNGYLSWWTSWVPASASIVDISHNLLRQPAWTPTAWTPLSAILLVGGSPKWPELLRVDVSHNSLWGFISARPPGVHYNLDVSYNNLSSIEVGDAGTFSASAYMRQILVVDWRNQQTPVQFFNPAGEGGGVFSSIDEALNAVDFQTVDYLPRHDSFEQVEYPKGSGEHPFSCPLW